RASSSEYQVSLAGAGSLGCVPRYNDPTTGGVSSNLTADDTYSQVIDLGFTFPLYGSNYLERVVSSNGAISFDISRAGQAAHYGILNSGNLLNGEVGDYLALPSFLYDPAQIMGVYHDMDITIRNNGARRISYETVGVAPNRKFIVSFHNVTLY